MSETLYRRISTLPREKEGGRRGEEGERGEEWVGRQSEGLGGVVLVYKIGLRRPVIAMAINRLRETEN